MVAGFLHDPLVFSKGARRNGRRYTQPSCLESASRFRYNLAEMRAFFYYIGYLAVAALWWIYRLLPARCAYGLGWHIGAAAFSLCRGTKRARTAVDNVIVAGLAANRRDAYRIARNALAHFAGHITEALRIHDVITKDNWPEYVTLDMTPAAHEAIFRPTGPIILATGHLGAWEAGIPAFVSARPMMVVARTAAPPSFPRSTVSPAPTSAAGPAKRAPSPFSSTSSPHPAFPSPSSATLFPSIPPPRASTSRPAPPSSSAPSSAPGASATKSSSSATLSSTPPPTATPKTFGPSPQSSSGVSSRSSAWRPTNTSGSTAAGAAFPSLRSPKSKSSQGA